MSNHHAIFFEAWRSEFNRSGLFSTKPVWEANSSISVSDLTLHRDRRKFLDI
jgi:hypothetical protein